MPLRARRERDVCRPPAVRRYMREPVNALVEGQLLKITPIRPDARDLGMPVAYFRIKIDPLSVRRVLAAVGRSRASGEPAVAATASRHREDISLRPRASGYWPQPDEREPVAAGMNAVQEMQHPAGRGSRGDPGRGSAANRSPVELPVIRRDVDVLAVRVEHVIVVELRDSSDLDPIKLPHRRQG